jgi:hypothetical protein
MNSDGGGLSGDHAWAYGGPAAGRGACLLGKWWGPPEWGKPWIAHGGRQLPAAAASDPCGSVVVGRVLGDALLQVQFPQ